jgi:hypothetical protein
MKYSRKHSRPITRAALLLAASAATLSAAPVHYRYYRFEPTELQQGGTVIQLSEFTFAYQGKNLNLLVSNPENTPLPTVGQDGTSTNMVPVVVTGGERAVTDVEGALKIADGSVDTKWITAIPNQVGFLTFDFGVSTSIDAYNFATGGDTATYPNRNPLTWKLSGSDDAVSWATVDREIGQPVTAQTSIFQVGYTATGVFRPITTGFSLVEGQAPIVRDGTSASFYWDAYDEDLGNPDTTTIVPSVSTKPLNPTEYGFPVVPPRNADTTYTMTATNSAGTSDPRTLWIRSVTGGIATYKYYRFTPTRTRSGADQVQMAEFSFYRNGQMLNLKATNASPAPSTGSNGTNTNVFPVTVTNPGGSNDPNADAGAVRLVDGDSTEGRFTDNLRKPIVFQFATATAIDSYQFITSFEAPEADPVRWIMEGSSDGTNWTMIENVTAIDYPVSTFRSDPSQIFPLPGPSLKTTIGTVPPFTWLANAATTAYGDAGNWSTGKTPATTDEVLIATGTPLLNANLDRAAPTTVSGTGAFTINGRIINHGAFNVSGGSLIHNGNYFLVGSGGVGTFNHTSGTFTSTVDRGWFISDNAAGSGSRYLLSGTGVLNVTLTGPLNDLYNVHFGKGAPGDVFNMSGGTASFTATGTNNVYLSQGASILVSGGDLSFKNFVTCTLGWQPGDTNHFDITGGSVTLTGMPLNVGGGYDGEVTLGGGTLSVDGQVNLGQAAGKGAFTMTGGQLTAKNITSTANGTFSFQGGAIDLTGDQTAIVTQSWFTGAAGTTATYDAGLNKTHIAIGVPSGVAFTNWAAAAGLTGAQASATADPDSDGIPNLLEFALNGDPKSAGSHGKTAMTVSSGTGVLTTAVRKDAVFALSGGTLSATIDGIRYSVLGSRDLATWTSEVEEVTPAVPGTAGTPDAGWTLHSFRLKTASGTSDKSGYLKLQVIETP